MIEIAPGIAVYSNVGNYPTLISDIEDSVVMNAAAWTPAYVQTGEVNSVDKNHRDTMTIGVPYSDNPVPDFSTVQTSFISSLQQIFFDIFNPIEKEYFSHYQVNPTWHDSYGILKYGVGQKFGNHIDDHRDFHRRVSVLYYLNAGQNFRFQQ
jgi:hypothetical protein